MRNTASINADGTGLLTLNGVSTPVQALDTDEARRQIMAICADEARSSEQPITLAITDTRGTDHLLITPDGTVQPAPDGSSSRRFSPADTTARRTINLRDTWRGIPLAVRIAVLSALGLLLALLPFLHSSDSTTNSHPVAASNTATRPQTSSDAGTDELADACPGGQDLTAAIPAAKALATTSTITQGGIQAPSPAGAASAALTFARLRSALPAPTNRAALLNSILASDATPAAKATVPAVRGWTTELDTSKARWSLTSGDGHNAGIDLLLTATGTRNGAPVAPTTLAVHMDLTAENGQWRLRDVGTPASPAALAAATTFRHTESCR